MEAPEEMGVAMKEQDDFAHEDPKWREEEWLRPRDLAGFPET